MAYCLYNIEVRKDCDQEWHSQRAVGHISLTCLSGLQCIAFILRCKFLVLNFLTFFLRQNFSPDIAYGNQSSQCVSVWTQEKRTYILIWQQLSSTVRHEAVLGHKPIDVQRACSLSLPLFILSPSLVCCACCIWSFSWKVQSKSSQFG